MTWVVYAIVVGDSRKMYVGRTKNPSRRFKRHLYGLASGKHHNVLLQELSDKHGISKVSMRVLKDGLSLDEAIQEEERIIKSPELSEYLVNILQSGTCGDTHTHHPMRDEIVARRTKTRKESLAAMTVEQRAEKYGKPGELNGMFGKTHTEEVRKKLSDLHLGNSYAKGLKRSPEMRAILSEKAKLRVGELNSFYGRTHTDETKEKLACKNRGKKPTNMRRVMVDGVEYESVTDASRKLSVCPATIIFRIKSKYWDYSYVTH